MATQQSWIEPADWRKFVRELKKAKKAIFEAYAAIEPHEQPTTATDAAMTSANYAIDAMYAAEATHYHRGGDASVDRWESEVETLNKIMEDLGKGGQGFVR